MRPVKIFFFLSFVLAFYRNPLIAQQDYSFVDVGTNTSFEAGTVGWKISNPSNTKVVTRDWPYPDLMSSFGNQLLKLSGRGYVSQWVPIPANTEYHWLYVSGLRIPKTPGADPMAEGWAGLGITYYDSNWTELEVVSKPIGRGIAGDPNLNYSGMTSFIVGGVPPLHAAFASVWVSNSSDKSELAIDNLTLYEVDPGKPKTFPYFGFEKFIQPTNPNLPGFLGFMYFRFDSGRLFPLIYQIGSNENDANGSMLLRAKPGKKYHFQLTTVTMNNRDSGQFGIDCYDASWKRLTTKNAFFEFNPAPATNDKLTGFDIQIPPNTAFTYFWVGVPKGKFVEVRNAELILLP